MQQYINVPSVGKGLNSLYETCFLKIDTLRFSYKTGSNEFLMSFD